jgi:hypothetical protein
VFTTKYQGVGNTCKMPTAVRQVGGTPINGSKFTAKMAPFQCQYGGAFTAKMAQFQWHYGGAFTAKMSLFQCRHGGAFTAKMAQFQCHYVGAFTAKMAPFRCHFSSTFTSKNGGLLSVRMVQSSWPDWSVLLEKLGIGDHHIHEDLLHVRLQGSAVLPLLLQLL